MNRQHQHEEEKANGSGAAGLQGGDQ